MGLELEKLFDYWQFEYDEVANDETYNRLWRAIELIDEDPMQAELFFKDLIREYPFFLDAYNHLSIVFKIQNKVFESLLTAEKSYNVGRSVFPKEFNIRKDELSWSIIKNRPFLRACQLFGIELQDTGNHTKALEVFEVALLLNENDNQGIRYLKLESLIALNDFAGAERLLKRNKDDWSIEFLYGKVSLEVIKGNNDKAVKFLANAVKANRYLPGEIIKTKHQKPGDYKIPGESFFGDAFPVGSVQEAFYHWERNKGFYMRKDIIGFYKKYGF